MGQMSCYTGKTVEWNWLLTESKTNLTPEKFAFGDNVFPEVAIPGVTPLL
jgi:hypothetical protein